LSTPTSEKPNHRGKRKAKMPHLTTTSVNMIAEEEIQCDLEEGDWGFTLSHLVLQILTIALA